MSEKSRNNRIEIRPIGSYAELDEEGYIINPTGREKIQPHWWPVIDETMQFYKDIFGDDLYAFFIRGSVAKGQSVDGVSDLDTLAYVHNKADYADLNTLPFRNSIPEKYPFAEGVEILYKPVEAIPQDGWLLIQSLQLYGEPIEPPKVKPGPEMISNARNMAVRMQQSADLIAKLKENPIPGRAEMQCVWLMKELLRIGVQLTYGRSGRFTRDLYLCYKDFAEYYPDHADDMYQVLDLALNPTSDFDEMTTVRDKLLPLLGSEAKRLGIVSN